MSVQAILEQYLHGELPRSLQIFVPELVLCVTILLLLLVRMCNLQRVAPMYAVALVGALVAFFAASAQFGYLVEVSRDSGLFKSLYSVFAITDTGVGLRGTYFSELLVHDHFSAFFRMGLGLFLVFVVVLTSVSGIPDNEDGQDFYTLLIGATVGMMLAAATNHLLMLFISVEMMSVPSYAMVAFLKGRKQSSEAALKYVVYGAGTAGVMLYGVSLISGLLGTALLPEVTARVPLVMGEGLSLANPSSVVLLLGIMLVFVGLAFKLSLAPFHFWCPDAFEGASAEVAGFLSVAPKAAAFALLVRFGLTFTSVTGGSGDLGLFCGLALGVISILSMTLGNLAAYTQNNLKRMLAYSTIAHAGYMVMAVAAMMVIGSSDGTRGVDPVMDAAQSVEGLMYYIVVYLFMNLTAFAIVAAVRNETFREDIDAYAGLAYRGGFGVGLLCLCLAISFFSLVGLPPLGGFFAKMMIFYAALKAGYVHWFMWVVLVAGGLNTVFSLFYYLRVLKTVYLNPAAEGAPAVRIPFDLGFIVLMLSLPIIALGASTLQGGLTEATRYVTTVLFL